MDEMYLASCVDSIDTGLSDSAFFLRLKTAITGSSIDEDGDSLKPEFDRCFSFEGLKCDVKDNEAKVIVSLKVLMCVNETYEFSVSCNWGTCGVMINPYSHSEGKIECFDFTLRKRPGKDVGKITIQAEGKVLSQHSGDSSSPSLRKNTIKELIKKRELTQIISALMSAAYPH